MNLTELIEEFKEATGRVDLSDNDITKYLNRGVKFLDEKSLKIDQLEMHFSTLSAGSKVILMHHFVRTPNSVWVYEDDTDRKQLKYMPLGEMRNLYKDPAVTGAFPDYYTISPVHLIGDNSQQQQASVRGDLADFPGSAEEVKDAIMVYPPADKQYQVEILGKFYSQPLSTENPTNWWSVRHHEIVIQAAIYRMDNNYRNTQGGRDLIESIVDTLKQLFYDELESTMSRSSIMEG